MSAANRASANLSFSVYGGQQQQQSAAASSVTGVGNPLAPSAWQELTDPESGAPYYYNPQTGVTAWEIPV